MNAGSQIHQIRAEIMSKKPKMCWSPEFYKKHDIAPPEGHELMTKDTVTLPPTSQGQRGFLGGIANVVGKFFGQ